MESVIREMVERGIAKSARECSVEWMQRAPNYVADRGGAISADAALTLYLRLRAAGHADLAASVWSEIVRAVLARRSGRAPSHAATPLPERKGLCGTGASGDVGTVRTA